MRLVSLLPAWLCLGLAACSQPTFTAEVKGETTVPAAPLGVGQVLNAFPAIGSFAGLDFNEQQDFKNQGVTKDQVSSARLRSVKLKILGPDDADFGFLDSLEFFAKAGTEEVLIARRDNIPQINLRPPNPVLTLELRDVELQPYLTAPSMSIIVRGRGRMPEKEVRLQATVAIDVEVDVL